MRHITNKSAVFARTRMKLREKDEENKMPDGIRRNGRTLWTHMKLRGKNEEDDGGWYPT